jgi:hypothetical protein
MSDTAFGILVGLLLLAGGAILLLRLRRTLEDYAARQKEREERHAEREERRLERAQRLRHDDEWEAQRRVWRESLDEECYEIPF